jgi:hypothetical protein
VSCYLRLDVRQAEADVFLLYHELHQGGVAVSRSDEYCSPSRRRPPQAEVVASAEARRGD